MADRASSKRKFEGSVDHLDDWSPEKDCSQ